MARTFVQIAEEFSRHFEGAKRDSGDEFRRLKDGAPEALTELVRDAHDQGGGNLMLPDDQRYEMVESALDAISNLDADADEDDANDALSEVEAPVYTAELTAWLASRADRAGYCDEAAEEYGTDAGDTLRRLALGWLQEFREVGASVLASLREIAEAEADAEDDAE